MQPKRFVIMSSRTLFPSDDVLYTTSLTHGQTTLPPSPTAAPVMPFRRADDDNYEAPKTIGTYTLTGTDYTTNADGLLVVGLEEASEIVEAGKTLSSASAIEAVSVSRESAHTVPNIQC